MFDEYYDTLKLQIHIAETKAMIFGSRNDKILICKIKRVDIEIVNSYKYLGTHFSKSGSFIETNN